MKIAEQHFPQRAGSRWSANCQRSEGRRVGRLLPIASPSPFQSQCGGRAVRCEGVAAKVSAAAVVLKMDSEPELCEGPGRGRKPTRKVGPPGRTSEGFRGVPTSACPPPGRSCGRPQPAARLE
jgi:hypothetical protein